MNRSRARAIRRKYQRRTRVTVQKAWILSALAAVVIVYGAAAVIREKGREAKGTQVSIETPDSTQMPEALETYHGTGRIQGQGNVPLGYEDQKRGRECFPGRFGRPSAGGDT